MDRAEVVAPLPGEPFVYMTGQFDRVLRSKGGNYERNFSPARWA